MPENNPQNYTIDPSTSNPDSRLSAFIKDMHQLKQIYSVKPLEYVDIVGEYWQRINDIIYALGLTETQTTVTNIGWTVPILGKKRSELVTEELGTETSLNPNYDPNAEPGTENSNKYISEDRKPEDATRDNPEGNLVGDAGTGKEKAHKYGLIQSIDWLFQRNINTWGEDLYNWLYNNDKTCIFEYPPTSNVKSPQSLGELLFNSWPADGDNKEGDEHTNPSWCEYINGLHSKGLLVETYNIVKYLGDDYDNYVNNVNYIKDPDDINNPANPLNEDYIEYDDSRNPLFVLKKIDIGQVLYGNKKTDINGNKYTVYENDYIDKNAIICENSEEVEYVKGYFGNQENIFNKFIKLSYYYVTDNPIDNAKVYPKVTNTGNIGELKVKISPSSTEETYRINDSTKSDYEKYKNNKFISCLYDEYPEFKTRQSFNNFIRSNSTALVLNKNFGPLYTLYNRGDTLFNTHVHRVIEGSEISSSSSTGKKYYYALDTNNLVIPVNFEKFNIFMEFTNRDVSNLFDSDKLINYTIPVEVKNKRIDSYVVQQENDKFFIDRSEEHTVTIVENNYSFDTGNNIKDGEVVEGIYVDTITYPISNGKVTINDKEYTVAEGTKSVEIGNDNRYSIDVDENNNDFINTEYITYNGIRYKPVRRDGVEPNINDIRENTALYTITNNNVSIDFITIGKYEVENQNIYKIGDVYNIAVTPITKNVIQIGETLYTVESNNKWNVDTSYNVILTPGNIYKVEIPSNDGKIEKDIVNFTNENDEPVYTNLVEIEDKTVLKINHKLYEYTGSVSVTSTDYGIVVNNSPNIVTQHAAIYMEDEIKEVTTSNSNCYIKLGTDKIAPVSEIKSYGIFKLNPNGLVYGYVNDDGTFVNGNYVADELKININDIITNFFVVDEDNNAKTYIINGNTITDGSNTYTLDSNNQFVANGIIYTVNDTVVTDENNNEFDIFNRYNSNEQYIVINDTEYELETYTIDENDENIGIITIDNVQKQFNITDIYTKIYNYQSPNTDTESVNGYIKQSDIPNEINVYIEKFTVTAYYYITNEYQEYNKALYRYTKDIIYDIIGNTVTDGINTYTLDLNNQFTVGEGDNAITYTVNENEVTDGTNTYSVNEDNKFTVPVVPIEYAYIKNEFYSFINNSECIANQYNSTKYFAVDTNNNIYDIDISEENIKSVTIGDKTYTFESGSTDIEYTISKNGSEFNFTENNGTTITTVNQKIILNDVEYIVSVDDEEFKLESDSSILITKNKKLLICTLYESNYSLFVTIDEDEITINVLSVCETGSNNTSINSENSFVIINNIRYPVPSIYVKYYIVDNNLINIDDTSYTISKSYEYNNNIYTSYKNGNNDCISINGEEYIVSNFITPYSGKYINYMGEKYAIEGNAIDGYKIYINDVDKNATIKTYLKYNTESYYELTLENDKYYVVITNNDDIIYNEYVIVNNNIYTVDQETHRVIIDNDSYPVFEYNYIVEYGEEYEVTNSNVVIVNNIIYVVETNGENSTVTIDETIYNVISELNGDYIYIPKLRETVPSFSVIITSASLKRGNNSYPVNGNNIVNIDNIEYSYDSVSGNIIRTLNKVFEISRNGGTTNTTIDNYEWTGDASFIQIVDSNIPIKNYLKVNTITYTINGNTVTDGINTYTLDSNNQFTVNDNITYTINGNTVTDNNDNTYTLDTNNQFTVSGLIYFEFLYDSINRKYYIQINNAKVYLYNKGYVDDITDVHYVIKNNTLVKDDKNIPLTQYNDGYIYTLKNIEYFTPHHIIYTGDTDETPIEKYIVYENEYFKIGANNKVKINGITYTLNTQTNSISIDDIEYHFVYAICIVDNADDYTGTFSTVALYSNTTNISSITIDNCTKVKTYNTISGSSNSVYNKADCLDVEYDTGHFYTYIVVYASGNCTINYNETEKTYTLTSNVNNSAKVYCYNWDFNYRTKVFVSSSNFTHFNYWYYDVSNTNYVIPKIIANNKLFVSNISKSDLSELVAWEVLDDVVKCGSNTATSVCLISDTKYDDFYYSVTPQSDTDDDDVFGSVISSYTDFNTGLIHSLSLVRANGYLALKFDWFNTKCNFSSYVNYNPNDNTKIKLRMYDGQYCKESFTISNTTSTYYKSYDNTYDIPNNSETLYKLVYHTAGPTSRGVTEPAFNGLVDENGKKLKTNWQSVKKSLKKLLEMITPDSNNNFNVVLRATNYTPDATLLDNADTGNVNSSNYVLYPYHTDMSADTYYNKLCTKHQNIIIVTMKALFGVTTNTAAISKFKDTVYPAYKLSTFNFDELTDDDLYKLHYATGITRVFNNKDTPTQDFMCDIARCGWINCKHEHNNVITTKRTKNEDNGFYTLDITYKDIFSKNDNELIYITVYYDDSTKTVRYTVKQGNYDIVTGAKLLPDNYDSVCANALINMMKSSTSYGFIADSTPLTEFTDIVFADKSNNKLYDLESNKTYIIDPSTMKYVVDNSSSNSVSLELFNTFGAGRFLTNNITGKTYFTSKEYDTVIKIVDPLKASSKNSGLINVNGSIAINPNTDHGLYINENNQLDCTFISNNDDNGGGITFNSSLTLLSKELGSYVNKMPNVFSIYGSNPNYELALISDPYEIVKNTGGSGAQLYLHGSTAYKIHNVNGTYATGEKALPGQFGIHATGYAPIRNDDGTLPAYNASNSEDTYIDKTKLLSKVFRGDPEGNLVWDGTALQIISDERKKANIGNIPDAVLDAWKDISWIQFNYKEQLCSTNMKLHTGLIAQSINNTFAKHGLKATDYGLVVFDEITDFWNVRYEEALAMEAAYQRRRADELEKRIERLEKLLKV